MSKVFCVIPALNEGNKIKEVLRKVKPLVDQVVVVDDGSVDQTFKIAKSEDVVVLRHVINRGQGASLETGNKYASSKGADVVVHFDADGQFLAEEMRGLIEPVLSGEAEVVLGSRFMGKKSNMPLFKKSVIMPIAHLVNRFVLGAKMKLTDPQCGFRVLGKRALEKIDIKQNGMAHTSEIIYKIYKNNLKVKEIPITVIYDKFGQNIFKETRGGGGMKVLKDLIIAKLMD